MSTNNPSIHYIDAGDLDPTGDHSNCIRFWESIKAQHAHIYGEDSAYNFAGCNAHGIRELGRGWDRSSAANGQQDGVDYNPGSRAMVCLMGSLDPPTAEIKKCISDFANEAFSRGMERPLKAHNDFVATSCPGGYLKQVVIEFNAGQLSTSEPTPQSQPRSTGGDEMILYAESDAFFCKAKEAFLTVPGVYCKQVAQGQPFADFLHNWGMLDLCPVPGPFIDSIVIEIIKKNKLQADIATKLGVPVPA